MIFKNIEIQLSIPWRVRLRKQVVELSRESNSRPFQLKPNDGPVPGNVVKANTRD